MASFNSITQNTTSRTPRLLPCIAASNCLTGASTTGHEICHASEVSSYSLHSKLKACRRRTLFSHLSRIKNVSTSSSRLESVRSGWHESVPTNLTSWDFPKSVSYNIAGLNTQLLCSIDFWHHYSVNVLVASCLVRAHADVLFRMWRHGIHSFLELLRNRLPDSLDHMLSFVYLAYSMMALLMESVPSFLETWIECLGDLARYRMAIEEADLRDREIWSNVARLWYNKAADRSPNVGRIQHHLAVLARPNIVQQL